MGEGRGARRRLGRDGRWEGFGERGGRGEVGLLLFLSISRKELDFSSPVAPSLSRFSSLSPALSLSRSLSASDRVVH